jgi:hypothetical protein
MCGTGSFGEQNGELYPRCMTTTPSNSFPFDLCIVMTLMSLKSDPIERI